MVRHLLRPHLCDRVLRPGHPGRPPRADLIGLLALLLMLGGPVVGCTSLTERLQPAAHPTAPGPTIEISVTYPGAAPEDIEALVVTPIEQAVQGLPGVAQIASRSLSGRGVIAAVFTTKVTVAEAYNLLRPAIQGVRPALPADVEAPIARQVPTSKGADLRLRLTADTMDTLIATSAALTERLARIAGVSAVTPSLNQLPSIELNIDRDRASALGLTVQEISDQIPANSLNPNNNIEDLHRLVLKTADGGVIPLAEVAEIRLARHLDRLDRLDGNRVAWIDVQTTNAEPFRELDWPQIEAHYNTKITLIIDP